MKNHLEKYDGSNEDIMLNRQRILRLIKDSLEYFSQRDDMKEDHAKIDKIYKEIFSETF